MPDFTDLWVVLFQRFCNSREAFPNAAAYQS